MRQAGIDHFTADFAEVIQTLCTETSGGLFYTEFLAASLEKRDYLKESVCWKAFKVFDRNCDGHISLDELQRVLNSVSARDEICSDAVDELMRDFDVNGDDTLDFEEFMLVMLRNCSPRRGSS